MGPCYVPTLCGGRSRGTAIHRAPVCSGGRTRTPNDWTRTSCVADYTTPEGRPTLPEALAGGAQTGEGGVAAEDLESVEQRRADRPARDRHPNGEVRLGQA